jgi:hypothetical protein
MGSRSILGDIQALDAKHLSNTADSELTGTFTRITSGKRAVDCAAITATTQTRIQFDCGQKGRALIKGGSPFLPASGRVQKPRSRNFLRRPASRLCGTIRKGLSISSRQLKGYCIHFPLRFFLLVTISSMNQSLSSKSQASPLAAAARA